MISLARFILSGYSQAVLVTTSTALMGLLLQPIVWVSGAVVALVTLVNGHRYGLAVTALASVATAVLALPTLSPSDVALFYLLLVWISLLLVAFVLRQTVSLVLSLQLVAAMGLVGVAVLYLFFPDIGEMWRSPLNTMVRNLIENSNGAIDEEQIQLAIDRAVRIAPGFYASNFMIGTLLSLYLARWWQAVIYNPGGFGKEFRALYLGKTTASIALAIALIAVFIDADMLNAMLLVVFALYLNQGLAVLHAVFKGKQLSAVWLYVVYLVMFFVPYSVILLALAGLADTWIDFRRRLLA